MASGAPASDVRGASPGAARRWRASGREGGEEVSASPDRRSTLLQ